MKKTIYCAATFALLFFLGSSQTVMAGHAGQVMSLAFSPDSKRLVSGSVDTTVKLWEVATGRELRSLETDYELVKAVTFSPDGTLMVAGTDSGNLHFWDGATGRPLKKTKAHAAGIHALAYSRDGKWLATAGADMVVKLWDASTGRAAYLLTGHSSKVYAIAFSPDGKWLASAGLDGYIRLWDVENGREARAFRGHANWIGSLSFSKDSQLLLSAGADGKARLWEMPSGKERRSYDGADAYSAAISPDGRFVLAAQGKAVKKWEATSDKSVDSQMEHQCLVRVMVYSPDGKLIASAGGDTSIKLWDAETGKLQRSIGSSRPCAQKEGGVQREGYDKRLMNNRVWR